MFSRQITTGRKKNLAIDASMNPRKRSAVKLKLSCCLFVADHVETIRMIVKNVKFAKIIKISITSKYN